MRSRSRGALVLAWLAYTRIPTPLGAGTRALLIGLRALTLLLLIAILLRPVRVVPPSAANNSLLPILVDVSRSMRLTDGDGPSRLERAQAIVRDLQARLGTEYRLELLTFGDALAPGDVDHLAATARRSDLSGAIADLADRHRDDRLAGRDRDLGRRRYRGAGKRLGPIRRRAGASPSASAIRSAARDREIVNLTAGEPLLAGASIDLSVSASSAGFGTAPVEIRVSANGRPVDRPPRDAQGRGRADSRSVHRLARAGHRHRLHRGDSGRRRRAGAREQHPQRAGAAASRPPQDPDRRRRAGLRAHLPQARARAGSRPRRRRRRAQGAERRWPRHVLRAGRRQSRRGAGERVSGEAIRAVRLRRHHLRQHRSRFLHARSARADVGVRRGAGRRPAGAGRPIVRSPGPGRHAARRGAADRPDRSPRHRGARVG